MTTIKERVLKNDRVHEELVRWYDEIYPIKKSICFQKMEQSHAVFTQTAPVEAETYRFISMEEHLSESGLFCAKERIN
mgnify:CR=1 FL=1